MPEDEREAAIKSYEQICTNIRVTDEISFKLLRLVPILSGAGIGLLTILEKQSLLNLPAVILISVFAAVLTFGLFRWELRNIETCSWLIKRAADLERSQFKLEQLGSDKGQFHGRKKGPSLRPFFGNRQNGDDGKPIPWSQHPIGKREAEKIIYMSAIVAWVIPILVALVPDFDDGGIKSFAPITYSFVMTPDGEFVGDETLERIKEIEKKALSKLKGGESD